MDFSKAVRDIAGAGDRERVLSIARRFFKGRGWRAMAYTVPSRIEPGRTEMTGFGLPAGFAERYAADFSDIDPFPGLVARAGRALRFADVIAANHLNSANRQFVDEAVGYGLTDGYIFPTFGPHRLVAAFAITVAQSEEQIETADLPTLQGVAQAAHLRIDQLEHSESDRPHLAPREIAILHWIARGKSNEEIAMILGSRRPTVATHIKRIFAKLDVSDRASAAVRGLKVGLIDI